MSEIFEQLHQSIVVLERALAHRARGDEGIDARILRERTERIAKEPVRIDRPVDTSTCLVLERCERRYAVPLDTLEEVAPMGDIAEVPGIPDLYLGVTARKGRIVAVIDLPRLFSPGITSQGSPRWMVNAACENAVCAIAADEIHDLVEVSPASIASAMPTFPALAQRYTVGVLEDRSVVLDLAGLLLDRNLHVEDRG